VRREEFREGRMEEMKKERGREKDRKVKKEAGNVRNGG
jgi:hypothetical protein